MPRPKKYVPPTPGAPQVSPSQGIELLRRQIEKADVLLSSRPLTNDAHSGWELTTKNVLEKAFGTESENMNSVMYAGRLGAVPLYADQDWWEEQRFKQLTAQRARMESLIEVLEMESSLKPNNSLPNSPSEHTNKVFLVHGHDENILHQAARLLEKLGMEVIVLREQPNQGNTIIEKFEAYSDVGFAVILLTGDDQGGTRGCSLEALRPRARQNVIFELGYFIGRLGRNRVCALYSEGVEVPSDYSGVVYTKIDAGSAWRFEVAKELRAAGYTIDLNLIF